MASEPIVSFVVERLNDLLNRDAQLLPEVDDQFRWIATELSALRCFLKDADERQEKDERVRNWVAEVIDVSYDAEDAIDTSILCERAKIEHMRHGFVGRVKRYSCIFCELKTRCDVVKEIRLVKSKIHSICRMRNTYGIRDINTGEEEAIEISPPQFEESDVVGLQEDIKALKGLLMNEEVRRCVISIVGMGGIGKTTLANKVYHEVKEDFDCYAFIYLSQQYLFIEIVKCIIKSVMSPSEEMLKSDEEDLVMILRDHFSKKRYLVVIDDIWTEEAWELLKLILPDALNRSRVMLTTRNQQVALHADRLSIPYKMRFLNVDESWELFLKRIFPGKNTPIACPLELEATGRKILKNLGGLPLAIVVLGGFLSKRDATFRAWFEVLERVSSVDMEFEPVAQTLALSYYDLPYYLKPCFLYFSAFREDEPICSKKLMRLWIAEGFIYERGNKVVEDVAKEYLKELSDRSIIQMASRRSDGSVNVLRIHDLLRELCFSEATKNNFFTQLAINDDYKNTVRRVALHVPYSEGINLSTPKLRSLLCSSNKPNFLNTRPKFLRVLDAEGVRFSGLKLPKEIGKLSQLRYLNLRNTCIYSLPNSIGKLIHLESLDIRGTRVRPMTTTAIQKLEQLRYLYMDMDDGSTDGDSLDVSPLKSLRVLSVIRVGQWMEDGLGKLIHLQKLGIYGDLYLCSFGQDLHKLTNLRSLRLGFGFGDEIPELEAILSRLPGLRTLHLERPLQKLPHPDKFPTSLTKLCLKRSLLEKDQMATLEGLPGLRVLKLGCGSFLGKKMVFSARGFPELRFLELDLLDELEEWIVDEGAMPNLQHLVIRLCNRLKELPRGLLHLCHQSELEVTEMPETFIDGLQRNKGKVIQHKRSVTMDGNEISMGASSSSQ